MALTVMHPSGFAMTLGLRRRPHNPRSTIYDWRNYTVPHVSPSLLVGGDATAMNFWGTKPDPRLPILNQGQIGSCSSFGALDAATAGARNAGVAAVELMHDWSYEKARKKEGTFPQDAGSDPGDILDGCISGVPPESDQPGGYVDNASLTFDQYDTDATQKYVASFHAIYPQDGMQALMMQAYAAGYPVVIATGWTNAMFAPSRGIVPRGQTPAQEIGGHCIYSWGAESVGPKCDNSWTAGWSADATASGFSGMRPGSFILPWEYFLTNSLVWSAYVVVPTAGPQPQPKPQPGPASCRAQADAVEPLLIKALNDAIRVQPADETQFYVFGRDALIPWAWQSLDARLTSGAAAKIAPVPKVK